MSLKKYQLDTSDNKEFLRRNAENLLRFGHRFPSPEGSAYYLGDDGTPWKDRPRETWITSRMVHVYCLGTLLGHPGSEDLADAALSGLMGELHDKIHGGWYAGRAADGSILPGKQCYAHAFVILAASSALLCGRPGAEKLLKEALDTYDRWFWNEEEGMSCDTWNTEFTALDSYRGINANMHTVEAFLAAADVLKEERYRIRAGRIIDRVIGWAGKNKWRIPEHFTDQWEPDLECSKDRPDDPFKPYGATPGHGIEWARLIVQWAVSTFWSRMPAADAAGPETAQNGAAPYIEAACSLYDRAVSDGWDADGAPGLCYTTDWKGNPVVHDRMHWTLAEAINSSAVLYRVTKDPRYEEDYAMFMQYLDTCVLDHVNGSWFHQLDRNNRLIGTVWPGKSDLYHALQAMLIPCSQQTGMSIAPALYQAVHHLDK
ncbi:MAG: AGE family epimerase/isomerase [Stomatobaculum sp.]|nr:AGE family epimerase/isomerase [Stomatobaculum sp.]